MQKVKIRSLEEFILRYLEEEAREYGFELKSPDGSLNTLKLALELAGKIVECEREYEGFLEGLEAEFIPPGPSGAITRGRFEILPTGRNFYAIDPRTLPTRAAWEVGMETAEKLISEYIKRHGGYPQSVGQVLWSIDAYKADGEQLSQILWLLGTRPIWNGEEVKGIEVVSLGELGRPRIDGSVRISGIVRDTLPNYVYLIDEAVEKVVVLDEPPELNFVKKHYLESIKRLVEMGRGIDEAGRLAKFRVFCSPPGAYGAGVNLAVESSGWKEESDLGKTWLKFSGYAYGRDAFGIEAPDALACNLKNVDLINRNHVSDEHDLTNCCCYFTYQGGFKAAAQSLRGKEVDIVQVDTRDITATKVVDIGIEVERVARTKLLNDCWIEEMKKHGYRGASEFSKKILHLYGWETTARCVEDWIFDEIARKYILDEEMRRWFEEHNPYAFEEIGRRLFEAYERGLWKTSPELVERLRKAYSEIEGILEDSLGEGEVQGGAIRYLTVGDDEHWAENLKEVEEVWKKIAG